MYAVMLLALAGGVYPDIAQVSVQCLNAHVLNRQQLGYLESIASKQELVCHMASDIHAHHHHSMPQRSVRNQRRSLPAHNVS
jgi:hypothetical protein